MNSGKLRRLGVLVLAAVGLIGGARGELMNAALADFGAVARGTGAPFNRQWPASATIQDEGGRRPKGGTIFGVPMKGGTVEIALITDCDIERIDLMQLDYHETMNVSKVEIAVNGKVVKTVDLAERPMEFQEIPLKARGRQVSVKCLETFPPRTRKDGSAGPSYGGWARIRVMTTTDVSARVGTPEAYAVTPRSNALMPTGTAAGGAVKVYGEARVAKGHPCTTWDAEDVKRFRAMMKSSPELKSQAEVLRRAMDKRMTQPLGVPQPEKDADGNWKHISDATGVGKIHNALSLDIANLGTCYQLFGDERYAAFCKRLLLAYADAWPNYGVGARPSFHHDPSKVFDQRLGDATWLIQIAVGYDFIHDFAGITPAEREHIEKDLVAGDAYFIRQNRAHLRGACNWSAIGTAAILAAGYACEDKELINTALFGVNWTERRGKKGAPPPEPNRWWEGTPNANPSGVELHFSEKCIDVDGMWCEGAMGYHFMALQALVVDAEILRHHGIDLYRYRDCALKCIFDSPLLFAYPNLIAPAIHDSGNASVVGREAYLYEYGYWRYRDPKYLEVLRRVGRRLAASFQQFTVSTLYDVDIGGSGEVVAPASVNLNGVGYGILRLTDDRGTRSLLLDYGPNRSHGHPDKLNLDLWGFGELLVPDPGSTWYENPIYRNWYRTTFAHNTLNVDMQEQRPCDAELLVYAPGETCGLMRGRTDGAYAGVTMDRALFLAPGYVADLFGAFSKMERGYDLAWHPVGTCVDVARLGQAVEFTLPEPRMPGYSELKDIKANRTRDTFRAVFETKGGGKTSLVTPSCKDETLFVTAKAQIGKDEQTPIYEHRVASSTVFGNVFTFDGSAPMVKQGGSVDEGYAVLTIQGDAINDTCYASFRDGARKVCGLETDAQQAFLSRKPGSVDVKALVLGGGTYLKVGGFEIRRSTSGSALVEITKTGSYLVRNCGGDAATVSGRVFKPFSFELKPGEMKEFFPKGGKPVAEYRQEIVRKLAALQAAKEAAVKEARLAKAKARAADAAKYAVPADFRTVVQAEDFVAQGGGEVRVIDTKTAAVGSSFSHWDADGQWLQWKVTVPATGYYKIALCYCSDNPRQREVVVNGRAITELGAFGLEPTGGFANGSDDWKLVAIPDPIDLGKPMTFKFEKGENTLRLANVQGGGVNVDYLVVAAPGAKLERLPH